MPFGIPINIATAAMEGIYERLCWIYITVITLNTLVYDKVGNTYHLPVNIATAAMQETKSTALLDMHHGEEYSRI